MHELVAEANRLSKDVARMMMVAPAADEVPVRIHSKETDAGGAPEFAPAFLRYIDQGVCTCGRPAVCAPNCRFLKDKVLGHLRECEPACRVDTRFHASKHKNHPSRMRRALRAVRRLNPAAYDLVYMVVALHMTFEQAAAKLNDDNARRGLPERSHADYAVLWVSGSSLLSASF